MGLNSSVKRDGLRVVVHMLLYASAFQIELEEVPTKQQLRINGVHQKTEEQHREERSNVARHMRQR